MRTPLSPIAHLAARTGRRAAALLVALALLVSIVPAALAAGTPTGSNFVWGGAPPESLVPGKVESDAEMVVYAEQTNFALTSPVTVDFSQPGTYADPDDLPDPAPTIPAGTVVNSYYIHADQTGTVGSAHISATIMFPDPIIGVILTDGRLSASEAVLGVDGTDYPTSGYELIGGCPSTQDCATLADDGRTLTLEATIYNVTDDLRVLTQGHGICPLYDQTKAHKAGSTVPIKLQLCSAGSNLSSEAIVVNATGLVKLDNSASSVVEDAGSANSPDDNFRYDATLGGDGGYIYNLSTDGLTTGTWRLSFTVNGVAHSTYTVRFDVK